MLRRRRPSRARAASGGASSAPRRESGSVLMLMPAAVMIVMVLGAIAVDLSVVRMGQRDLIAAAGDAANDAVTVGLDEAALRSGDGYRLDPGLVHSAVADTLAAKGILADLEQPPVVTIESDSTVTVRLVRRVPHLFAKALPGAPDDALVRATATASVEQR